MNTKRIHARDTIPAYRRTPSSFLELRTTSPKVRNVLGSFQVHPQTVTSRHGARRRRLERLGVDRRGRRQRSGRATGRRTERRFDRRLGVESRARRQARQERLPPVRAPVSAARKPGHLCPTHQPRPRWSPPRLVPPELVEPAQLVQAGQWDKMISEKCWVDLESTVSEVQHVYAARTWSSRRPSALRYSFRLDHHLGMVIDINIFAQRDIRFCVICT